MKARIKGTNEIVECLESDHLDHVGFGINCKHSNGCYEIIPGDCLIEVENDFDWQSFRAEAAKDILAGMMQHRILSDSSMTLFIPKEKIVSAAIGLADELIKQLKEREEK